MLPHTLQSSEPGSEGPRMQSQPEQTRHMTIRQTPSPYHHQFTLKGTNASISLYTQFWKLFFSPKGSFGKLSTWISNVIHHKKLQQVLLGRTSYHLHQAPASLSPQCSTLCWAACPKTLWIWKLTEGIWRWQLQSQDLTQCLIQPIFSQSSWINKWIVDII